MDIADPHRPSPNAAKEEPTLANCRTLNELPRWRKSSVDIEKHEPNRDNPLTAMPEPRFAKFRKLRVLPR